MVYPNFRQILLEVSPKISLFFNWIVKFLEIQRFPVPREISFPFAAFSEISGFFGQMESDKGNLL